ncbi:MAG: LacI family DNA-binding transcriptional regulator [Kineosporiaceae bacterium]|nr:LacI family DNA-binding transcriptional regulator [Kineosporiaceae bacterium]
MRRPTMDDVAARAGVSRSLVSLVMQDSPKVSAARRTAVREAAAELGYAPHTLARELASGSSSVLAVLVSDLRNPYFADVVEGVEAACESAGLQAILITGGRRPSTEERAIDTLLGFRPAGLVLLSPVVASAVLARACRGVPVAAVERAVRLAGVDTIVDDGRTGATLAVDHLVGLGHQAIVHLDGGRGAGSAVRRRGYAEAMARHGLTARIEPSEYTEQAGAAAVGRLLATRRRFTALVAANDINAVGAIAALEDAGLRVPQDVSVIGYDNTRLAALRHIGLTTVDQPRLDMGRLAVECVTQRRDDPTAPARRHRLDPTLVVRTTTGPPPASA